MSWVTDYFAQHEVNRAKALADAEREARESGKELFDLARFERHLNRGSQAARERDHRMIYYLLNPEVRTLAEYARILLENEPWEDCR